MLILYNHGHDQYADNADRKLKAYQQLEARMSLKIPFLHSPLDLFSSNLGEVSDKQGKHSTKIIVITGRYHGSFDANMMGDAIGLII